MPILALYSDQTTIQPDTAGARELPVPEGADAGVESAEGWKENCRCERHRQKVKQYDTCQGTIQPNTEVDCRYTSTQMNTKRPSEYLAARAVMADSMPS